MSPAFVRNLILPLHERLCGRDTLAQLRALTRSQFFSLDALRALQTAKLRRLLSHSHRRVPAYRARINSAGIDPRSVELDDLVSLPTLNKDDLRGFGSPREHPYCDPEIAGGLHRYTTGGSSGNPLVFYVDRGRQAADQAGRARSRRWFGIQPGEREFYLWGAPVELGMQDRLRTWRDRLVNQRLVNAFDLTPGRMDEYLDALERFDPVHIFGYPSSLARLARHAESRCRAVRAPALRGVFVTGEVLSPRDRETIGRFFGAAVADGYGSREAGFIAHECPHGRMHVNMETMIVELLDEAGRRVGKDDAGEITVTHLDAHGMPFIRYRTGDLAQWDMRECPCGRKLQTLAGIEGRRGDAILTPDGNAAHPLSVMYALRECPVIREFRVTQARDFSLDVRVVPTSGFNERIRQALARQISRRFGDRLAVRVSAVDEIKPDPAGKHRPVRSEARLVDSGASAR